MLMMVHTCFLVVFVVVRIQHAFIVIIRMLMKLHTCFFNCCCCRADSSCICCNSSNGFGKMLWKESNSSNVNEGSYLFF